MHNNVFTYRWLAVFTAFAALILHLDNAKVPLVWAFAGLTGLLLVAEIRRLSKEVCSLERSHTDRTLNENLDDVRRSCGNRLIPFMSVLRIAQILAQRQRLVFN